MKLLLLYNPIAGAGRSAREAMRLADVLERHGHEVSAVETQVAPTKTWLDDPMRKADLAVALGGDGVVRLVAPSAMRVDRPVYHYPQGTENLLAREFGQRHDPAQLVAALKKFELQEIDVGEVNGHIFLLMMSVGVDAEVVHDLAARRGNSISHLSYLPPIARQVMRWQPPGVTVRADDDEIVTDGHGCVIVASSQQYAMRLNPARRASMTDGLFDMLFLPAPTRVSLVQWMFALRTGRHMKRRDLIYVQARDISIQLDQPRRYQVDGDPPPGRNGVAAELNDTTAHCLLIALKPRRLSILLP